MKSTIALIVVMFYLGVSSIAASTSLAVDPPAKSGAGVPLTAENTICLRPPCTHSTTSASVSPTNAPAIPPATTVSTDHKTCLKPPCTRRTTSASVSPTYELAVPPATTVATEHKTCLKPPCTRRTTAASASPLPPIV